MEPEPVADAYSTIAQFYDLEHAGYDEDIDLYRNLASVVGDPIIELGCGTGRILAPLADAGHQLTGVDASSAMLDLAKPRLVRPISTGQVQLVEGDFATISEVTGGPFGLAIVALNGLMHVVTLAAQRDMLREVRSLLDPRGMLVIDLINPSPVVLQSLDQSVVLEGSWALEDGSQVAKFASRRVLIAEQLIETRLWYDHTGPDGSTRRTITHYPMRWVHRGEIELMLELAGFAEWHVYGSYDMDPFEDDSERLIVAAEVTRS